LNNYYLDTCSLKWRYLFGVPTADVNSILDSSNNNVYIGELTILEWSSALACAVKEGIIDERIFKSNELALFKDVADQKLKVFQAKRLFERARSWIEYIGVVHKRSLKTNDAIHISTALELSAQVEETVEFVTCDQRLYKIVDEFGIIKPHLNPLYFAP
jgi:predicted nucleic acid-binding protein